MTNVRNIKEIFFRFSLFITAHQCTIVLVLLERPRLQECHLYSTLRGLHETAVMLCSSDRRMCHVSVENFVTVNKTHRPSYRNCKTETREMSAKWWCCFQLYYSSSIRHVSNNFVKPGELNRWELWLQVRGRIVLFQTPVLVSSRLLVLVKVKVTLRPTVLTASPSWYHAPTWDPRPIFPILSLIIFTQFRVCWCGAPSLTRSRVRTFQFLPGIASASFLRSESHETHVHSLLSLFLRLPPPGGPGSCI
jgi:hypothetical protein